MILEISDYCLKCSAFGYFCSGEESIECSEDCGCNDKNFIGYDEYALNRINRVINDLDIYKYVDKDSWNSILKDYPMPQNSKNVKTSYKSQDLINDELNRMLSELEKLTNEL